jgi:beta-glucuronidase
MERLLPTYPHRTRIDLNGLWDFAPTAKRPRVFREQLPVPGVWESAFRYFRYRGQAWYRREFDVPQAGNLRLHFGAVTQWARVWFDGQFLGEHQGAHTAFEFVIPKVAAGTHEVAVLVDNTFGPHNPLHYPKQDIYLWGGIPRSVFAEVLPANPLSNVAVLPRQTKRGWELLTRNVPRGAKLTLSGTGVAPVEVAANFRTGETPVPLHGLTSIEPWSPANPRLYTVRVVTGNDVWQERIGFRTISKRGRQLLLNDEPLILKGVNRHEFHPDFGPALPLTIQLRDIEILKELGANFVRGSHYPNDPLFLDLCDEAGILFWEELSHWQPKEADLKNPLFLQMSLRQADEMVTQHQHHPSIILWGMCNELDSDVRAARPVIRKLTERFHKLDPTRLVTYATCKPREDACFDLVDVVALNIYPGWYGSKLAETAKLTEELIAVGDKRGGHKPIILSEFGAAAMTGVKSMEARKWTENYQADLLRQVIDTARTSGKVSGVAIWQYCDVRVSEDRWGDRIREYNNKGIVSDRRDPKLGFYAVQELFRQPWKKVS